MFGRKKREKARVRLRGAMIRSAASNFNIPISKPRMENRMHRIAVFSAMKKGFVSKSKLVPLSKSLKQLNERFELMVRAGGIGSRAKILDSEIIQRLREDETTRALLDEIEALVGKPRDPLIIGVYFGERHYMDREINMNEFMAGIAQSRKK